MRQCFTFTYSIRLDIRGLTSVTQGIRAGSWSEHKEGASRATSYRGP